MKIPRRQFVHLAASAAVLPAMSRIVRAQTYPTRPVRFVVGWAAGGVADIFARLMGQWLSERLGQQFVIENRPGAGGNIGTEAVVHAFPDGYTLLLVGLWNAIDATLYEKLNFDFIRDIAPVTGIARLPNVMAVNPSLPAKTVPEFIAYAKANPGKINMASGGIGGPNHMSGELFKMMTGVNILHVPYRGEALALTDLLGGQVKKCDMYLCHSDLSLQISRRANTGAMRFANLRPTRRRKAGRVPRKWNPNLMTMGWRRRTPPKWRRWFGVDTKGK